MPALEAKQIQCVKSLTKCEVKWGKTIKKSVHFKEANFQRENFSTKVKQFPEQYSHCSGTGENCAKAPHN